jgi:membrane-bound lytic murein transglycosylase A
MDLRQLPGWDAEDHLAALGVARQVCRDAPEARRWPICDEVLAVSAPDDSSAKGFLESQFRPEPIPGVGLLTAYFAPTYPAREMRDAEFSAAVRPLPPDAAGAPARATLDAQRTPDALAWMRPEDLFFLQIQGSGALVFPGGRQLRAVFAGANGRPYVAIASPMVAEGLIAARDANAGGVHAWLAAHRGSDAEAVMRLDPRYVFFRLLPDDGAEPHGSAGVALTAGRSLAVDPAHHPYFELLWIDADEPTLAGARPSYRRLAAALDTGSAIKGDVRADLYLGRGDAAGAEASAVRHRLQLYRIVPISP